MILPFHPGDNTPLCAFRDKHALTVPLLADEYGGVAKAYGAHRPLPAPTASE